MIRRLDSATLTQPMTLYWLSAVLSLIGSLQTGQLFSGQQDLSHRGRRGRPEVAVRGSAAARDPGPRRK